MYIIFKRRHFLSTHSWWNLWSFSNTPESPECPVLLLDCSAKAQSWSKGCTTAPTWQTESWPLPAFVESEFSCQSFFFKLCQYSGVSASGYNAEGGMHDMLRSYERVENVSYASSSFSVRTWGSGCMEKLIPMVLIQEIGLHCLSSSLCCSRIWGRGLDPFLQADF